MTTGPDSILLPEHQPSRQRETHRHRMGQAQRRMGQNPGTQRSPVFLPHCVLTHEVFLSVLSFAITEELR